MTRKRITETAVLIASDWHFGKLTESYNCNVAATRLNDLRIKMQGIRQIESGGRILDKLVVLYLGDCVDGADIYPGHMAYTAEPNVEAQANRGSTVLADWLVGLGEDWGHVDFVPIPGNHGRSGKHMHLAANWDTVTYNYVAQKVRSKRVTVDLDGAASFVRLIQIRGHTWLLHHGNYIRMWLGIPWYGISRRLMNWATTERLGTFEVAAFGHFHTLGYWPINRLTLLTTGTPVTDDEWAREVLGMEAQPLWWLVGASDAHAITFQYALRLAP